MTIQESERTLREVGSKNGSLGEKKTSDAPTLANAIFAKGRTKRVGVVLLGAAFVAGAAARPAAAQEAAVPAETQTAAVASVPEKAANVGAVKEVKNVAETAFSYRIEASGATITCANDRNATTLVIPATIDGVSVTKIAAGAFEGMRRLESVSWSTTARCQIESRAFANCSALKKVELPEGLEAIPEYAFVTCPSLETISGGKNVRTIGERAFSICRSLKTLPFGDLVSIGEGAFYQCDRLTAFDFVSSENAAFQLVDGLLLSKDGKTLYACPPGRTGEVVVPDGVVTIAKSAFEGGNLESVVLPRTLEIIDANAFKFCDALKSVLGAPEALETIGASAFAYCRRLERFDWPENLQVIEKNAFTNCGSLTGAEIKSVRRVGEGAFAHCRKLASLSAPSGTREIEANAFAETALTTFKLPRDLETLQPGAFADVALENLEVEEGNAAFKIVDGALLSADGKTLYFRLPATPETTWKIPDGVRVVARSAFSGSKSLVSLEIPEGVEKIGENAFYGCSALQKLTIPASLREIDANFASCSALSTFEVADGNPNYRSVDGSLVSKDGKTLYRLGGNGVERRVVPNGVERLTAWSCAGDWRCVEIAPTVKRIDATAFGNSENLTAIKIPASVERLDERFVYCPKLTSFEVAPENPVYKSENGALLSKDGKTFYRLVENLRTGEQKRLMSPEEAKRGVEYVVPEGVETIVGHAFVNRDEITKVVLPQSLRKIEKSAFSGCSAYYFTSVSIPAGVETIEPGAFSGCNLREVVLESNKAYFPPETFARSSLLPFGGEDPVVRVDEKVLEREAAEIAARIAREEAFLWGQHQTGAAAITGVRDRNATTLDVPETIDGFPVQSIATEAFAGMPALKTIRIPASVQTIEMKAFENCRTLEKVEFVAPEKSRLRQIDASAFKGCSSLKTFEAPDFLRNVGVWAFADCSALETVKLGSGAAQIGDSAFKNCVALQSVEISEDANAFGSLHIDRDAFAGCDALLEFAAPKRLAGISGQAFGSSGERATPIKFALHPEGRLKNVDGLIVSPDGKTVLAYFGDERKELVIPEGVEWLGMSFGKTSITSVRLPKSLRRIGAAIFSESEKLERVEIPEDALLESIESSAFRNCKALKSFAWPKSLKSIEGGAFNGCESLESFVGATGVEKIGAYAFCDCFSLATIELGSGLLEIGESAFAETAAKSIKIPASVRSVGAAAFATGELETLEVEEGNEAVMFVDGALLSKDGQTLYRLLSGLKLKSYKIPDGVLVIKRAALGGNATLEELTIPESVTTIENNAFYRCSSLKKIRIPAKVVELSASAFERCDSLESFEVAPENPTFKSENGALLSKDGKRFYKIVAVERDPSAAPYVLPPTEADDQQREIAAYKNPVYRVPDGVESLEFCAFYDVWQTRNAFTEIVLPESLKSIANITFQGCWRLETARIPASVETIGPAAFARCYALKTFEIAPENPAYYVADGTLVNKKNKTVCDIVLDQKRTVWKIPEGVERLDATWVTVRFNIPEIILPESLTSIGKGGLAKSANLTKITIPKNVCEVENGAFAMCPKLEEVVLKSAKTKISNEAFFDSTLQNPFEASTPTNVKIRVEPDEEDAAQSAEPAEPAQPTESTRTDDAASVRVGTAYGEASDAFDVRIVGGEATILGTRSRAATLTIPEKIDGALVTKIAPKAFANNKLVKEIVFPSTLREIGADAFLECVALEKISPLPAGLSFESVRVQHFFLGCDALQGVSVDPNHPDFNDVDGVLFSKNGATIYFYPRVRTDEFYQVPDGVQRIGDCAFAGNAHIKRVKFPWSLQMIDSSAFAGCRSLETLEFFPVVNSLQTIAYGAFSGCDSLKSINLPDGVGKIRGRAFACRSLETVEFYPVDVEAKPGMTIETAAFVSPKLKSFELPETLKELHQAAIQNAGSPRDLEGSTMILKIPKNLEKLSSGAFGVVNLAGYETDPTDERWKAVDGVLLSKDGKTLYDYPRAKKGNVYEVPDGVERISTFAFNECRLREIRLPKTLRTVENFAFSGCRVLETLEVPEGVVNLGAFGSCDELRRLKLPSTLKLTNGVAGNFLSRDFWIACPKLETFEIAPGAALRSVDGAILSEDGKTLYFVSPQAADGKFVVPESVETIAADAFYRCEKLESVVLPSGLKKIEARAFFLCRSMTAATIPASVGEIARDAFNPTFLRTIAVESGNANFKVDGTSLFDANGNLIFAPSERP